MKSKRKFFYMAYSSWSEWGTPVTFFGKQWLYLHRVLWWEERKGFSLSLLLNGVDLFGLTLFTHKRYWGREYGILVDFFGFGFHIGSFAVERKEDE